MFLPGGVWSKGVWVLEGMVTVGDGISGGSRIFPRGVRQLPKVLLFFNFFVESCIKMKEFEPPGGRVYQVPPWICQWVWLQGKGVSYWNAFLLPYALL